MIKDCYSDGRIEEMEFPDGLLPGDHMPMQVACGLHTSGGKRDGAFGRQRVGGSAVFPRENPDGTQLLDAYESLDERQQFMLDALLFERLSVRDLALRMGASKSTIHRHAQAALRKLEAAAQ